MTTDHEGDEVFEQLRAEHHELVKDLAANLDLDAGLEDALMSIDHTPGEATVTLPVSMLRRWADTLEGGSRYDTDPGFETGVVAEAIRAVLADTLDSSPDPEGAGATEVAPDSDTATEAHDD